MPNYLSDSRYIKAEKYNTGDCVILKPRKPLTFSSEGAYYHTFEASDTLEGLAFKYYGNEKLYWVILDANPKYMSELNIQVGDVLTIPQYDPSLGGVYLE